MNSELIRKCDKLIKSAKNNTLFYDDIIDEIRKNKYLFSYSCTIPNALEYLNHAGITIIDSSTSIQMIDLMTNYDSDEDDDEDDNHNENENEEEDNKKSSNYEYIDDSTSYYLRSLEKVQDRLLTAQEECELCIAAQNGDIDARNKMITYNLKLVVSIAKHYIGVNVFLEYVDLIQAGNIGLLKAIDKFDPEKGFRFSTYATCWIRQSITRSLSEEGNNIRLPVHVIDQLRYIKHAIRNIKSKSSTGVATNQEIADYCNKNKLVVRSYRRPLNADDIETYMSLAATSDTISLYTIVDEDEHGQDTYLADFIADPSDSIEDQIIQSDLRDKLEYIFENCLTKREADVLRLRYGFNSMPKTLEQIGQMYGLTRERIRQIELKAKKKIRTQPSIYKLIK